VAATPIDVAAAVAANPVWYHTIELPGGVLTPGQVDLRAIAARVLPDDLSGLRALDVGTFDGFWAFEMERRGAEVMALDLPNLEATEWPPRRREALLREAREMDTQLGRGFRIAAGVLGSRVTRVEGAVTDLEPEQLGGPVDFVFCGALLIHLPRALERMRLALNPGGRLVSSEPFSYTQTILSPRAASARFLADETDFNWWAPNLRCLRAWVQQAGFSEVRHAGLDRVRGRNRAMHRVYARTVAVAP